MRGAIAEAWEKVGGAGWGLGHAHLSSLYPMPGNDGFENDDLFVITPIFPTADGGCVFVSEDIWEFPVTWHREYETRAPSWRRLNFELDSRDHPPSDVYAMLLVVKRAMYLEVFKARKPLGLSTLQKRLRIYLRLAAFALELGKPIRHFDEKDLLAFVPRVDKSSRKSLVSVYELLRWWKVLSGAAYPMFNPPAPLETIDGTPEELWDETSAEYVGSEFRGVDLDNVRADDDESDDPADEGATYQPLPDAFVGPMGEFCIRLLVEVAPIVDACLVEVMSLPTHRRQGAAKHVVAATTWPSGLEITNLRGLRSLAYLCQAALIFLLSLVLGCRWSEISSLPITALQSRGERVEKSYLLVGPVHKGEQSTAGIIRDWPLAPEFAGFIQRQVDYVKLTEGSTFKFLWRSHKKPWRSRAPLRGSQRSLDVLARASGCATLLDGTSFHHHRFRKTTARLVVVALHGGPTILRRLFGHETLTITLRYILVNDFLIEEMREIAAEEERRVAASLLEQRQALRGGGADKFREAVDALIASLNVSVPSGKREQATISMEDVLDVLETDGTSFSIKQIVPGLVSCNVPRNHQGMCAGVNEPPNLAKCDSRCVWHLVGDGYLVQARINVANALEHMSGNAAGSFAWRYFEGVVRGRLRDFPELAVEFSQNAVFLQLTEASDDQS